jgi:hypothetical protein
MQECDLAHRAQCDRKTTCEAGRSGESYTPGRIRVHHNGAHAPVDHEKGACEVGESSLAICIITDIQPAEIVFEWPLGTCMFASVGCVHKMMKHA